MRIYFHVIYFHLSSLLSSDVLCCFVRGCILLHQENWPELKKNPTDEKGEVIAAERKWSMPLPGPWRHGSIKGFLKQYVTETKHFPECGSSDEQALQRRFTFLIYIYLHGRCRQSMRVPAWAERHQTQCSGAARKGSAFWAVGWREGVALDVCICTLGSMPNCTTRRMRSVQPGCMRMKSLSVCGLRSLQPGCMGIKPISRFFVVCAKVFTSSGGGTSPSRESWTCVASDNASVHFHGACAAWALL